MFGLFEAAAWTVGEVLEAVALTTVTTVAARVVNDAYDSVTSNDEDGD